jgi:hypothetical protein
MSEKRPKVFDVVVEYGEDVGAGEIVSTAAVGDFVEKHQVVAEVDTGKVTVELVAPVTGRVTEVAPRGEIGRGAVIVRVEEVADPLRAATLREATKVRRALAAEAAAKARAEAARAPVARALQIKLGEVMRQVDLGPIDARIASLGGLAHAEAAAHLVRVARALAVAPALHLPSPMRLAYVSVRAGVEARTVLSVALDHDEGDVTEVTDERLLVDAVVVRFHDTVERVGLPLVTNNGISILLATPRLVPVRDARGAVTFAERAELSIKLTREPGLCQRVLGALAEQLERG